MDLEERISRLENSVNAIDERNRRVELEKAWETSRTRTASILTLTYLSTSLLFYALGVERFFFNALVPTLGYFLSIRSLPYIKTRWLKR